MNFLKRLLPPDKKNTFSMDGYFVWDGSIIKDKDDLYHLFASYWPEEYGMQGWLTDSKIIRATSSSPMGPYTFQEEIVSLNEQPWAKNMVHNPRIYTINGKYYLYYIGTNWGENDPKKAREGSQKEWHSIRFNQRIGLAIADSPKGPWSPIKDNPVLDVRAGEWDALMTVNPSLNLLPNGTFQIIYKSTRGPKDPLILGAAIGKTPYGPFKRVGNSPLFEDDIEDPYFWEENGSYWMLAKDMTGVLSNRKHSGVLYHSKDALNWVLNDPPLAYDRTLKWVNTKTEDAIFVERPYIYLENKKPMVFTNSILLKDQNSCILFREIKTT